MRVLINTPPLNRLGGVANFYLSLRGYLGNDVVYFHIGRRSTESRLLVVFRLFADYFRFMLVLFRENFEIVHLNPSLVPKAIWRDAVFVLIARAFGKKIIIFMHGWNKDYEKKIRQCYMWPLRMIYFCVNAFIVLAIEFKTNLRSMGYSGPIYLNTTTFDNTLLLKARDFKARGAKKQAFNILFLSRIERQKGIFEALDALAIIQAKHPSVSMTIAGNGTALTGAQKYVQDNSICNVSFLGYIHGKSKAEAFATSDCYLFPSYSEGMPITVIEAMAFGLPIIARPVGALADFFVDGEMGFLTESKNPIVFAQLIERLMEAPDLCDQMGRTNREYAMLHFSPSNVADSLVAIYRAVAEGEYLMPP